METRFSIFLSIVCEFWWNILLIQKDFKRPSFLKLDLGTSLYPKDIGNAWSSTPLKKIIIKGNNYCILLLLCVSVVDKIELVVTLADWLVGYMEISKNIQKYVYLIYFYIDVVQREWRWWYFGKTDERMNREIKRWLGEMTERQSSNFAAQESGRLIK